MNVAQLAISKIKKTYNEFKLVGQDLGRSVREVGYQVGKNQNFQNLTQPTIQAFKEGAPALGRISAQTNPLIRTQLQFQPQLKQQLQPQKGDVVKTAKMGLYGYGLSKLTPAWVGTSAVLGGGLNKLQGGSFTEGATQAIGRTPPIAGVVGTTNPILARTMAKLPIKSTQLVGRTASAVANVMQGLGIDAATGLPTTPTSVGVDIVTGLLGGPNQFGNTTRQMTKAEYDQLSESIQTMIKRKRQLTETGGSKVSIRHLDQAIEKAQKILFNRRIVEGGTLNLASKKDAQGSLGDAKVKGGVGEVKLTAKEKSFLNDTISDKGFIADIGQLSKAQRKALDLKVKEGVLEKGRGGWTNGLFKEEAPTMMGGEKTIWRLKPSVAQPPVGDVTKSVKSKLKVGKEEVSPKKVRGSLQPSEAQKSLERLSQTKQIRGRDKVESYDDIISRARKQIGSQPKDPKLTVKQQLDNFYTQWVDRYNPFTRAAKKAQKALDTKKAVLLPQNNPEYLVRRLTGAGGIADYRFKTELQPVLKEIETAGISKADMDVYLANKRMAGFGTVERTVYGSDPVEATKIVQALNEKYGTAISDIAEKLYKYQDKGFQEIIDSGFVSPDDARIIKSQNPDYAPLYRVMDELDEYLGVPTRKAMQGTQPIKKIKGSRRKILSPVESIIGNTFRQRAAIEKNRVARSLVDLQKVTDMGFEKVSKSGNDTITIWQDGQKEYWKVGKEIADVAKGANEEVMNLVLKVLRAPAALLRQGATGRNPEFMIPNIVRDQLDAGITSKYGYIPFIDYVSGLKSMLTNDDVYQKWQNSGAKIALGEMSGQKTLKQLQESTKTKKGLFKKLSDVLDVMGKYSEQPTRVGLFKKAYGKTGSEMLALMESRDATVDFARMGSKMKVANSIVPFLNVGVQGFDKLIRAAKNQPGRVLTMATIYGVAPAAVAAFHNLQNYAEEYNEIPQYEKDNNFVIVKGRNENGTVDYVTFPKGNILPVIANPVEHFINYAYQNDQQSFGEMATQALTSILPVVGEGQSLKEVGLRTIGSNLPQAVKPITENIINKSFYKYDPKKEQTKDIVPYFLQKEEPYQQDYEFTPQMYKKIGALVNASPLKVKNLMEGYLAGYSKIPAQIIEMLYNYSRGEEIDPNDKTLLRRFLKQTYPSSAKPAKEETKKTPLMERVTGKASAAEEEPEDLTEARKQLRDSDEEKAEYEGKIIYKTSPTRTSVIEKDWEEPKLPKVSGDEPWDDAYMKKQIANYKNEITKRQNAVMKLYELEEMTYSEAYDEYLRLDDLKKTATNRVTKPKVKGRKKKVPIQKFTVPKLKKIKSTSKAGKITRVKTSSRPIKSKPYTRGKFRSKL